MKVVRNRKPDQAKSRGTFEVLKFYRSDRDVVNSLSVEQLSVENWLVGPEAVLWHQSTGHVGLHEVLDICQLGADSGTLHHLVLYIKWFARRDRLVERVKS